MRVSIITVVYNRSSTINAAINSVLGQTYPSVEYIIVDGGSTDGTKEIIEGYGTRVHKFLSEKDTGIYDALNKGIELASGDIIGVLHSDDVFANNQVIEAIVNEFEKDTSVDALYGDVAYVKKDNPQKIIRYYSSANFSAKKFEQGYMPAHPSFFCKKRCFGQFGNYKTNLKIGADFDLLLRFLATHRIKTTYLPICTTIMTLGGESTKGIQSLVTINKDFYQALAAQGFKPSYLKLYSRYLKKWREFLVRKQQ